MNILFVLYGDLTSNSANPLALYACELASRGHSCVVAIPNNLESLGDHAQPAFKPVLYGDALSDPASVFPDGRPADVIHAWTPRENVRRFVTSYMAKRPTPLLVYLEDHESWIACRALGLEEETLFRQTEKDIGERLPDALSHPYRYKSFIGLADVAVLIQEKLSVEVPPWVKHQTVMPGVDLDFFSPRVPDGALRARYGVAEKEYVIVYPGGVNGFTKPGLLNLCRAVGLINSQGYRCRLLRTGPFALDFLGDLPEDVRNSVIDLGVVPRHELPDLLALADVFVQPGEIDPFEDLRLPGKLPELLAMGRPVVTPNVNIAHLLADGVDAVLTHTGSAEEIAAKCIGLFSDPQKAEKIGLAGRRFAEIHFDIKVQALCLENAYKAAIDTFNYSLAEEVWQNQTNGDSMDPRVVRKLNFLSKLPDSTLSFKLSALLKEHASLVESKRARVEGLESVIRDSNTHIDNINQIAVNREKQIDDLNQAATERARQIHNLNEIVAGSDRQVEYLKQAVAEKDRHIVNYQQELHAVRKSLSWVMTAPLRWLGRLLKG